VYILGSNQGGKAAASTGQEVRCRTAKADSGRGKKWISGMLSENPSEKFLIMMYLLGIVTVRTLVLQGAVSGHSDFLPMVIW
jgi:hypothetical protein